MNMRLLSGMLLAIPLMLVVPAARGADDAQKKDKAAKAQKREPEKVEMKDVPAAVTEAAKKELPKAAFTAASKRAQKKQGAMYTLEGKEGKYAVSLTMSSSGELIRLVKSVETSKKKASKAG